MKHRKEWFISVSLLTTSGLLLQSWSVFFPCMLRQDWKGGPVLILSGFPCSFLAFSSLLWMQGSMLMKIKDVCVYLVGAGTEQVSQCHRLPMLSWRWAFGEYDPFISACRRWVTGSWVLIARTYSFRILELNVPFNKDKMYLHKCQS